MCISAHTSLRAHKSLMCNSGAIKLSSSAPACNSHVRMPMSTPAVNISTVRVDNLSASSWQCPFTGPRHCARTSTLKVSSRSVLLAGSTAPLSASELPFRPSESRCPCRRTPGLPSSPAIRRFTDALHNLRKVIGLRGRSDPLLLQILGFTELQNSEQTSVKLLLDLSLVL